MRSISQDAELSKKDKKKLKKKVKKKIGKQTPNMLNNWIFINSNMEEAVHHVQDFTQI